LGRSGLSIAGSGVGCVGIADTAWCGMSDEPIQRRGDRPRPGEPGYVDERAETGQRGYRWPQFTKRNEMAVRHGATVDRIVDPIADELISGLLERRPDLVAYPEALHAWGRAESRCLLLAAWFAEHGLVDGAGKPTASAQLLGSSERMANEMRQRLGIDPASEAALANAQADAARSVVDLDALRARGREALEARRKRERLAVDRGHLGDGEADRDEG
jgi:hypothetical protein